jgi:hypothetical protein
MKKDTLKQSLFGGRLGSALLSIITIAAVQYGISETEVNGAATLIAGTLASGTALISAGLAVVSKIRETTKGETK